MGCLRLARGGAGLGRTRRSIDAGSVPLPPSTCITDPPSCVPPSHPSPQTMPAAVSGAAAPRHDSARHYITKLSQRAALIDYLRWRPKTRGHPARPVSIAAAPGPRGAPPRTSSLITYLMKRKRPPATTKVPSFTLRRDRDLLT